MQPDPHKVLRVWDNDIKGFGVLIYPSGRRSYCIRYRNTDRIEKMHKLGVHGHITAEEARVLAKQKLGEVAKGEDPSTQKKHSVPFSVLVDKYLERHVSRKSPKSQKEDIGMINRVLLPTFKDKLLSQVTFDEVQSLHLKFKKEPYRANRLMALLSKMFSLAIAWVCPSIFPTILSKKDHWTPSERHGCDAQVMNPQFL